jgi:hypothetical protein
MKLIWIAIALASPALILEAQDAPLTLKSVGHENQAGYVIAEFSMPVDPHIDKTDVTLTGVSVTKAFREPLARTKVQVQFSGELPQSAELCFTTISYTVNDRTHTANNLCGNVESRDVDAEKQALITKFKNVPKVSDSEKDIFASGFVTTSSSGSVGGADIALNGIIQATGLDTFLNIKKATGKNADQKNFEGGMKYQYVMPWSRKALQSLRDTSPGPEMNTAIENLQKQVIAGAILAMAAKLEGEATQFNVANFVGETSYDIRTETKSLFSKKGFWRGFLIPGAFEGGKTLNTTATSGTSSTSTSPASMAAMPAADWLARYKAGGGFTAFYEDWGNNLPIKRFDVDLNIVMRDRLLKESVFNSSTNTVSSTGKGIRAYGEAAVKVYIGQTSSGRYGVRLSYNRGSLPPVYAKVKSFQLGFLFESSEDRTKKK